MPGRRNIAKGVGTFEAGETRWMARHMALTASRVCIGTTLRPAPGSQSQRLGRRVFALAVEELCQRSDRLGGLGILAAICGAPLEATSVNIVSMSSAHSGCTHRSHSGRSTMLRGPHDAHQSAGCGSSAKRARTPGMQRNVFVSYKPQRPPGRHRDSRYARPSLALSRSATGEVLQEHGLGQREERLYRE